MSAPAPSPRPRGPAASGRGFGLWMAAFFLATAAIVTGWVPLEPGAAVAAIYALEVATVVVLAWTWLRVWAPAARRADRRLREAERSQE